MSGQQFIENILSALGPSEPIVIVGSARPDDLPDLPGFQAKTSAIEGSILDAIEEDIRLHPEHVLPFTQEDLDRVRELTDGVVVDLDETLDGDVTL